MSELVIPSGISTYYIEYYERLPGASIEEFRSRTIPSFEEWSRRFPEDELVLNAGRTWRLGPYSYFLIWGCSALRRIDRWDSIFRSAVVDDLENPLLEVMNTSGAGFYRDVGSPLPRPGDGPFFLETFTPWVGAEAEYRHRAEAAGVTLSLLIERIGLLAPEPGGIALFSLRSLSDAERLAEPPQPHVAAIGLYERAGREIL